MDQFTSQCLPDITTIGRTRPLDNSIWPNWPSKEQLNTFIAEKITHTDRSNLQQALFHLSMRNRLLYVYWVTLGLIGALILVTWPTDYKYFTDPDVIETYFHWRLTILSGITVFLILMVVSDFVRRNIFWLLYCGVVLAVALTGYLFGQIRSVTLETPWFYVSYIIPFITIVINVRIVRRIITTAIVTLTYVLAFLQFRPGAGYWGYEYNDMILNTLGSVSLISVLLGHLIYHLNRNNFLQSRQLRAQRRRIQELASHDQLTGLHNRREFENRIKEEFTRSQRYDKDLSCLMIDLDHFKEVNDTYGHPAGDRVLEEMGELIRQETRTSDIRSRYGGEEFSLALTETPLEDAGKIGERLRKELAQTTFDTDDGGFSVTCSMGITQLRDEDDTYEDTLKRADKALYNAKAKGRNCIVSVE